MTWRITWRRASARRSIPTNASRSQRLTPNPGGASGAESAQPLQLAMEDLERTGSALAQPRPSSSAATIERWRPPVQPMPIVSRVLPSAT